MASCGNGSKPRAHHITHCGRDALNSEGGVWGGRVGGSRSAKQISARCGQEDVLVNSRTSDAPLAKLGFKRLDTVVDLMHILHPPQTAHNGSKTVGGTDVSLAIRTHCDPYYVYTRNRSSRLSVYDKPILSIKRIRETDSLD